MTNYPQKTNQNYYSLVKIIHYICLLALMSMLVTGCSNEKNDGLQQKVDDLTSKYEELQEEYDQLKGDHEDLQSNYESLQSDYDSMQSEIEGYQDQQATVNDLNNKLTELQGQYDTLQSERDNLLQQLDAKRLAEEQAAQVVQQQAITQSQSGETVYWTSGGECYHSTADCSTLKRSKNISSGTVEQSGRRPCKVCH